MRAYKLAKHFNENGITARFDSLCSSACITVFSLTESVQVTKTALFIDHANFSERMFYLDRVIKNSPEDISFYVTDFISQSIKIAEVIEPTLFKGNRSELFMINALQTGLECVGVVIDGEIHISVAGKRAWKERYDAWLLDAEHLRLLKQRYGESRFDRSSVPASFDVGRLSLYSDLLSRLSINKDPIPVADLRSKYVEFIEDAKFCNFPDIQ